MTTSLSQFAPPQDGGVLIDGGNELPRKRMKPKMKIQKPKDASNSIDGRGV